MTEHQKSIPLNKISFEGENLDLVKVKHYKVYGKKYVVLEFNGSYFIQSNAGNIHTCIGLLVNG